MQGRSGACQAKCNKRTHLCAKLEPELKTFFIAEEVLREEGPEYDPGAKQHRVPLTNVGQRAVRWFLLSLVAFPQRASLVGTEDDPCKHGNAEAP